MRTEIKPKPDTILAVDDDPATRFLVCEALEPEGFIVEQAANGRQALEVFDRVRPNLVNLDVLMPEMDGLETCLELRRRANGSQFPIMMMTALDDHKAIDQTFQAGATDFITNRLYQSEQRLAEATHAAEQANRAMSTFLANMSHELRPPLNAILAFSDLIRNKENIPTQISEYVEYGQIFTKQGLIY